jgi:hypothetical protein
MELRSAGELIQDDYHRVTYTNYTGLLDVKNLSDEEKILLWLKLRNPVHLKTTCLHVLKMYYSGTYIHLFG